MNCKKNKSLLIDYYENELPLALREEVGKHLSECKNCRKELESIEKTMDLVKSVEVPEPSERFWINILPQIHQKLEDRSKKAESFGWLKAPKLIAFSSLIGILLIFLMFGKINNHSEVPSAEFTILSALIDNSVALENVDIGLLKRITNLEEDYQQTEISENGITEYSDNLILSDLIAEESGEEGAYIVNYNGNGVELYDLLNELDEQEMEDFMTQLSRLA